MHFLSSALKTFRKQKMYAVITTVGLSVALGASLLVLSFVNYELSFEKCHKNLDRIYRVGGKLTQGDYTIFLPSTMRPLGPSLKDALPEVEEQVRIRRLQDVIVKTDKEREYKEPKFLLADPSVFRVFSVPLIYGESRSVLREPNSVVISEKISRALFAGANPLGETITIHDSVTLTVTGVMADLPLNTQIHTDFLASYVTLEKMGENLNSWSKSGSRDAYTYLLLSEGANPVWV